MVDLPCLPSATFEIVKVGGLTEQRRFDVDRARRLAKIRAEIDAETADLTVMTEALLQKVEGLHRAYRVGRCGTIDGPDVAVKLAPPRVAFRTISKEEDCGGPRGPTVAEALATLDTLPNGERSLALMKLALSNPILLDNLPLAATTPWKG